MANSDQNPYRKTLVIENKVFVADGNCIDEESLLTSSKTQRKNK